MWLVCLGVSLNTQIGVVRIVLHLYLEITFVFLLNVILWIFDENIIFITY